MIFRLLTITVFIVFSFSAVSCTKSKRKSSYSGKSVVTAPRPWNSHTRRSVRTTAYSHKENEPGADGRLSAAGTTLKYGRTRSAAADWSRYPLGTQFKIAGSSHTYEIDDYGSALVGTDTIDLFKPSLRQMREWGTRHVDIHITKWGSFERSSALLERRLKYPHCRAMHRDIQPQLRRRRSGQRR